MKSYKWLKWIIVLSLSASALILTAFLTYILVMKHIGEPKTVYVPGETVIAQPQEYIDEKEKYDEFITDYPDYSVHQEWEGNFILKTWNPMYIAEVFYYLDFQDAKEGTVSLREEASQLPGEDYSWIEDVIAATETFDPIGIYGAIGGLGALLVPMAIWTVKQTHKNTVAIAKIEGANNVTKN